MALERFGGEIVFRDKATGQFRSVEKEVLRLNKTVAAGTKGSKAAAASLKQLRQAADLLGKELAGDVAPSAKRATNEIHNLERQTGAAARSMRGMSAEMGVSAAKASAFTRAATRGVAAIGFISPTAATASAQLIGLTDASAAATLAIGAGAVGAIALGTALVASVKAAINFESSFRGIRKTVEATEEEYASLERQNRRLARSLGESVNTINDVGKAAGQLGIAIGDIARFEKIIIELVSATDLVASSASLSLGGLRAVLGLTIDDLDRLTDQLVSLGNQFAATEPEIVGLLSRIAGAGAVLRIPAQDLLSIATAFAHVRVQQEAAGTAIQKVFLAIQRASVVGGKELRTFARMLGITTQEFRQMTRTDPTRTFVAFVNALSRAGSQAQIWLEELGLTDQRLRRTFLKMAAAQGVLNEAISEGNEAYAEGVARTEEHEKALATTHGQLKLVAAAFVDLGISIGEVFLPAINAVATAATIASDALSIFVDAQKLAARHTGDFGGSIIKIQGKTVFGWKSIATAVDLARGAMDIFRDSSDSTIDSVGGLGSAATDAASAAATLDEDLGSLSSELDEITTKADDARKALFAMLKEPTLEEEKAKLAVLELKEELLKLQTKTTPLTKGEENRLKLLKTGLIPSAQRLADLERTRSSIAEKQQLIDLDMLRTREEQLALTTSMVLELRELNRQMALFNNEAVASAAKLDPTWELMKRLVASADEMTRQEFAFAVEMRGEENVRRDLQNFLKWGGELTAEDFVMVVRIDGAEEARRQLFLLLEMGNEVARRAIAFGLLEEKRGSSFAAIVEGLSEIPKAFESVAGEVVPDVQALMDSAEKAKKAVDPLADGIISLAEAAEFGFTVSTAATVELGREQEKLADRLWRTRVETEKIERSYATNAVVRARAVLELSEAEVEASKKTVELRTELAKLFIVLSTPTTALRDAAQLILENQVAAAQGLREMNAELVALEVLMNEAGVTGAAATFRHAIVFLEEEFQQAGESATRFFQRLAQASLNFAQQRFDDLFSRPTREQAQLNLALAEARRRRALATQSGNEDLMEALDKEIERIQNVVDLRRAEEDIMRARADLVDATLLTEAEQMRQAQLLIGMIATQSSLTDTLNTLLDWETLALMHSIGALSDFTAALTAGRDALGGGVLPRLAPQRTTAALTAGTPAQNITMKFEVNVNVDAQLDDVRRKIHAEVDNQWREQVQDAGFGGSIVSTGTYRPE